MHDILRTITIKIKHSMEALNRNMDYSGGLTAQQVIVAVCGMYHRCVKLPKSMRNNEKNDWKSNEKPKGIKEINRRLK